MPYTIIIANEMGNQNEEVSKRDLRSPMWCFLHNLGEKNEKQSYRIESIAECSFCFVNNLAGELYAAPETFDGESCVHSLSDREVI
jgi:hypothetical protein